MSAGREVKMKVVKKAPAGERRPRRSASTVYFAPAAASQDRGPYQYLDLLWDKVKAAECISEGDSVAIKVHFGELGNTRYVRPILIGRLVELAKRAGGSPFVTDTTTLYRHHRHTLFEYLETARKNGFTSETMGCPVIIADGLKNAGVEVPVAGAYQLRKVSVAQAIHDADVLITANHLTLHPEFPWAAALKNIGMGCSTKQMKLAMHGKTVHPNFNLDKCIACGLCLRHCPGRAFSVRGKKIRFDASKCVSCGDCFSWCKGGALRIPWGVAMKHVQRRLCDVVRGVLSTFGRGKVCHFTFGLDITRFCDCAGTSTLPIVPDIGIFASADTVAIDVAALDMLQSAVGYPGGELEGTDAMRSGGDKVKVCWPSVDAQAFLETLARARIGSMKYVIERVA